MQAQIVTETDHTISHIQALVADEFSAVNSLINKQLDSNIPLIQEICQYIIGSGGKRMRPLVVLLTARACGYQGEQHIILAAIIEMLHTATLLHDDVVDTSEMRRGQATANAAWGNEASILVGDFLYSRVFQMMTQLNKMPIMALLADTTNTLAEGEMLQLVNRREYITTEANYLKIIQCKTAVLFAASAKLGAMIAEQDSDSQINATEYGTNLGMAFQLVDDVLDYTGNTDAIGKNRCDDLAEGKTTLPLIYTLQHCSPMQAELIKHTITEGGLTHVDTISKAIKDTGALDYTLQLAQQYGKQAADCLANFTESPYRDALEQLTQFSFQRNS